MANCSSPYHHGDLPQALRSSAAALIAERGVAGFSLREVARRAGVSHAAPAHHFGDAAGLLTAVAIEAFDHLIAAMESAGHGHQDPVARLRAIGRAYVELGSSNPGHCAVMFRHDLLRPDDETYTAVGNAAFATLVEAVQAVADAINPDIDIALASATCWTAMQGLVELHSTMDKIRERADNPDIGATDVERADIGDWAEAITQTIVDGLRAQLPRDLDNQNT